MTAQQLQIDRRQATPVMALSTAGLARTYTTAKGARTALYPLDLQVAQGRVHGLLGPNGAGKTTLCKMLSTVLLPSAGTATVMGHDIVTDTAAVRRLVGIVFGGERGLYNRLSARDNLRFWAAMYGHRGKAARQHSDRLLERVGLTDRADDRVETYSRGMKQRLHLARGLVGDPTLLILDEPTIGLDPVAAHDFRELIREQRVQGRTVLITTHDMAEAEAVCDEVSLLDAGRILRTEDPKTIGQWISKYERIIAIDAPDGTAEEIICVAGVLDLVTEGRQITVTVASKEAIRSVLACLVARGVTNLRTEAPSLEEVYLQVIGRRGLQL